MELQIVRERFKSFKQKYWKWNPICIFLLRIITRIKLNWNRHINKGNRKIQQNIKKKWRITKKESRLWNKNLKNNQINRIEMEIGGKDIWR